MMLRLAGFALLASIGLSALLGYAASFSIDPVVSQELVIAVEDVTTTTSGGPAEAVEEEIPYLVGNGAVVAIEPPAPGPACVDGPGEACVTDAEPEPVDESEEPELRGPEELLAPLTEEPATNNVYEPGFAWILSGQ